MKVRLGTLKAIIGEAVEDARQQLGMTPSTSIPSGRVDMWRDSETSPDVAKKRQSKEQAKAELLQRIKDLKAAQLAAIKRYNELSSGTNEGRDDVEETT